jgi:tetratricopeptide (TPR) repeat protein
VSKSGLLVCTVCSLCALASPAWADKEAAKAHFKKGLAAYALARYDEAAREYEAAFDADPQAALLYDAAQAHRLAGNKERALLLYQNYLRLFPDAPDQADVRRLIETVRKAVAADAASGTSPPVTPQPLAAKPEPPVAATPPPITTTAETATVVKTAPHKKRSKWAWGVAGGVAGVAVVGLAVGLSIGLSGSSYPSAATTVTVR